MPMLPIQQRFWLMYKWERATSAAVRNTGLPAPYDFAELDSQSIPLIFAGYPASASIRRMYPSYFAETST